MSSVFHPPFTMIQDPSYVERLKQRQEAIQWLASTVHSIGSSFGINPPGVQGCGSSLMQAIHEFSAALGNYLSLGLDEDIEAVEHPRIFPVSLEMLTQAEDEVAWLIRKKEDVEKWSGLPEKFDPAKLLKALLLPDIERDLGVAQLRVSEIQAALKKQKAETPSDTVMPGASGA
ncbi:MAG TPA: hypothetical protein VGR84_19090 [Candidatus Acidoferrales bacterium]|nr:hypothetical protein [Candidatus Acidoferrales bacterium]